MRFARMSLMVLAIVGIVTVSACDDDTRDKARETVESAKEKAGEAGARASAEAVRASLEAQNDDVPGGVRDVEVLREAAKDLPGDPEITGIDDADGDGRDDDGYVQAKVGNETACITVPASGDDVEVSGGACPAR
jgi:hypothetical protein